jgi:hypothetical protein
MACLYETLPCPKCGKLPSPWHGNGWAVSCDACFNAASGGGTTGLVGDGRTEWAACNDWNRVVAEYQAPAGVWEGCVVTFGEGDRVWYEAAQGVRFAGVVTGDGSLPNTRRVRLAGHYWEWRGRRGCEQSAVSVYHLSPRQSGVAEVDGEEQHG